MTFRPKLHGIRINLSGSVPDGATDQQKAGIIAFVEDFTRSVLRAGGTLVHGSHPSLDEPLKSAAVDFVSAGGSKDALTLVRAQKYAISNDQIAQIEAQREYSTVQIVPSIAGKPNESLVPMREWMAERCDVVVAIGGRHWSVNQGRAGVPAELEEALRRGRPAFLLGGFGGAIDGYAKDRDDVFSRLRNGLTIDRNRALAVGTNVEELVSAIIAQIPLLPLVQESVSSGRPFRILALDGGGLRGTFSAAVLAKWDDMIGSGGGNQIVKNFDMVAGTSTGAILAIGLAAGVTPLEMLNFYRKEGPKIFPKDRRLRHWLKSKHESSTLRSTLESVLGTNRLSRDSCVRLVIPTVRAVHGEAESIVTAHSLDRMAFRDILSVDAALASSAAPTYFDEAVIDGPIAAAVFLDGGIWANNPVLPAIAEAVRYLKVPFDRLDVLSIGTLGSEPDFTDSLGKGKAGWAPTSANLFFAAQEHAAATLATSLLSNARILRVNQLTPSAIKLDDTEAIEDMALRGSNVGQDSFSIVRSRFLDGLHPPDWRSEPIS